jgi:hypothetical protein
MAAPFRDAIDDTLDNFFGVAPVANIYITETARLPSVTTWLFYTLFALTAT